MEDKDIYCKCKAKISPKNVFQIGIYFPTSTKSLLLIKYYCPHCKKMGKTIIENSKTVKKTFTELSGKEKDKFGEMGPITKEEIHSFKEKLKEVKSFI